MSVPESQPPGAPAIRGRRWKRALGAAGLGGGAGRPGLAIWALGLAILHASPESGVVLENAHVRVARNVALCQSPKTPGCGDRVLVALADLNVRTPPDVTFLTRGDALVLGFTKAFHPPPGEFVEVTIKPRRPPVLSPPVLIPPDKNRLVYDGDDFFVFEERLEPGETRARHSHRERVVIVLNRTRLQQWPDGSVPIFRDQVPDDVRFNPPVVHVVKNIGDRPLRNIVIELKR